MSMKFRFSVLCSQFLFEITDVSFDGNEMETVSEKKKIKNKKME